MTIWKSPMRTALIPLAAVLAAAIPCYSGAQKGATVTPPAGGYRYTYGGGGVMELSPVQVTHRTLVNAARMMGSALPVYDVHRNRAIELARLADEELGLAVASAERNRQMRDFERRVTPSQRASRIPKRPDVPESRYSAQQVLASNAQMQKGILLLQQGIHQLRSLGRDPDNHVSDAVEFAAMAAQSANQGLQSVTTKR